MPSPHKVRLSIMMFLQFFIWGSWYATGGNYMKSHGMTDLIYLAYLASPIGSVVSPFLLGQIADRFYPVQKVLGVMHLLSGLFVTTAPIFVESSLHSGSLFLVFLLFHMLCYMPTVNLAAATAFHLLDNREREFPRIRMFGTIGWIAAGIVVSYILHGDNTSLPMRVAGAGSLLMGIYSFTLPSVPPPAKTRSFSVRDVLGVGAFRQLWSKSFAFFILSLLLISIPFASYFAYVPVYLRSANIPDPAFRMTFGQMSEIIFLLILPWFFSRLGVKGVFTAGITAWILRYALFALGAPGAVSWMIMIGILLHGACYDFVYVAGQIYLDKKAPKDIRAQAQGMFVWIAYGVGQGLGTLSGGWIFNRVMEGETTLHQWRAFWTIPLVFAILVWLIFVFGFRDKTMTKQKI